MLLVAQTGGLTLLWAHHFFTLLLWTCKVFTTRFHTRCETVTPLLNCTCMWRHDIADTIHTIFTSLSLHLCFNGHFPGEPGLAGVCWSKGWWRWWWQLNYWSYKSCKAPVKSSPPTNQHPVFLQAGCPSSHPTNSVKALKGKYYIPWTCFFLENECEALPGVAYPGVRDNRSTLNTKTGWWWWWCLPQAHLGSSNFVSDH